MNVCRSAKIILLAASLFLASVAAQDYYDLSFSAIAEANEFMDELLTVHLPKVLAKRAILREFSVHIPKKLFVGILPTHRDINAFFSDGEITGLAAMTRKNDCKPTRADGRFSVISCTLDISSAKATFASSVTGFNLLGEIAHPTISVHFNGTEIIFEAKQQSDGSISPQISSLAIDRIQSEVRYNSLGFNAERDRRFREEIIHNVEPQLVRVVNGVLYQSVHDALRQDNVNLPEIRI